jgi:hypothetical protein
MEIAEFQQLTDNFKELQRKIVAEQAIKLKTVATYLDQYDPERHDITDKAKRPDKVIEDADGNKSLVEVTRLPIPYQKKIVLTRATFLCGNPVQLVSQPADTTQESLMEVLQKTWDDNKLDYESKGLAKTLMSETEVAELWYTEAIEPGYWKDTANDTEAVKFRLRMKILSNGAGDMKSCTAIMVIRMIISAARWCLSREISLALPRKESREKCCREKMEPRLNT